MFSGKKILIEKLVFFIFLSIKYFCSLSPFFLFFSMLEGSRPLITSIPKILAGRSHIVPSFLFFDKQFKNAIRSLVFLVRKRQPKLLDFQSKTVNVLSPSKLKKGKKSLAKVSILYSNKKYRLSKLADLIVYGNRFYSQMPFIKFNEMSNFVIENLKKNYLELIINRTYVQYR